MYNVNNHLKNKIEVYKVFFNIKWINSYFEKLFVYSYFKFIAVSNLENTFDSKFNLKDNSLIFNPKSEKLQVIVQFRPPLLIIIYFVYLTLIWNFIFQF